MNKNNTLFSFALVFFVGLLILSGCTGLMDCDSFEKYSVGDCFSKNRDGYIVKLNDSFFANITYKNEEIEIYKLLDTTTSDYFGNSDLYYSDNIGECYCNNSNIIVYSLTNNQYIIIDCNDMNNTQRISETDLKKIDLSEFTKVTLP